MQEAYVSLHSGWEVPLWLTRRYYWRGHYTAILLREHVLSPYGAVLCTVLSPCVPPLGFGWEGSYLPAKPSLSSPGTLYLGTAWGFEPYLPFCTLSSFSGCSGLSFYLIFLTIMIIHSQDEWEERTQVNVLSLPSSLLLSSFTRQFRRVSKLFALSFLSRRIYCLCFRDLSLTLCVSHAVLAWSQTLDRINCLKKQKQKLKSSFLALSHSSEQFLVLFFPEKLDSGFQSLLEVLTKPNTFHFETS